MSTTQMQNIALAKLKRRLKQGAQASPRSLETVVRAQRLIWATISLRPIPGFRWEWAVQTAG